jgi:protein-disulfide isomerase
MLKLPPGAHAAIFEMEDLGCPACAHAAPIIQQALKKYNIPYLRHDFPLAQHIWTRDGAIIARYLQDKVSPQVAEEFRLDVFQNQMSISSKDDLQNFARAWFAKHHLQMPFALGPDSVFAAEVQADSTMGDRLGVNETPTIIVIGPRGWTQVKDVTQLYSVIDNTLAESPLPAAHGRPKKAVGSQQ